MANHQYIIPAIITQTQIELISSLKKVSKISEIVQLDIMDGTFVQNTSLNFNFNLFGVELIYEAHLMITNPMGWIEKYWEKVDTILFHIETTEYPEDVIFFIKKKGKKVGVVINPITPVKRVMPFLYHIDQLLIMTVHPGFYGSAFLPETIQKIHEVRELFPNLNIEVDGGITSDTIRMVSDAGANMFVSGSFLLQSENINDAMEQLKSQIR